MSDRKDARKIRPHPHHQGVCVGDRSAPATWDRLRGLGRFSHWALQVAGTSFAPLSPWHGDPLSQERAVVGLARQLPAVPCWIQRRWLWPLTALRHNPGSSLAVSLGRLSAVQTMDNRFQGPSQPNLFRSQTALCLYSQGRSILAHSSPISLPSANVWTPSSPCRCVVNHCQFKYTIFLDLNPHLPALHTSPFQVPVEAKSPEQQQPPNTLEHSATAGETANNTR